MRREWAPTSAWSPLQFGYPRLNVLNRNEQGFSLDEEQNLELEVRHASDHTSSDCWDSHSSRRASSSSSHMAKSASQPSRFAAQSLSRALASRRSKLVGISTPRFGNEKSRPGIRDGLRARKYARGHDAIDCRSGNVCCHLACRSGVLRGPITRSYVRSRHSESVFCHRR